MRILIVVHNLIRAKSHLMPWRTVCDVVSFAREEGHDVSLISLGDRDADLHGRLIPSGTKEVCKYPKRRLEQNLQIQIEKIRPDVIFWPASWRESKKRITIATSFDIPVVLWFPGGVYSLRACIHAIKVMGLRATTPYILEVLSRRKIRINYFKRCCIRGIISMTKETADNVIAAGWPESESFVIPPGKETKHPSRNVQPLSAEFVKWLCGRPFYLFMGPPSGIRGIFELLKAFDIAAERNQEICLVCLFRADAVLDSQKVLGTIEKCRNKSRILSVSHSLSPEELNGYMASCHAVTMPFILVPSEIPLAIIEAMAWGKPLISTCPGGTGEFVKEFGLSPKVGDIEGLAEALVVLHVDRELYTQKCLNTVRVYGHHPDWRLVSRKWMDVAQKVKRGGNGDN